MKDNYKEDKERTPSYAVSDLGMLQAKWFGLREILLIGGFSRLQEVADRKYSGFGWRYTIERV